MSESKQSIYAITDFKTVNLRTGASDAEIVAVGFLIEIVALPAAATAWQLYNATVPPT